MSEYVKRFKELPDILELDRLTVAGDVTFGDGVSLKVRSPDMHKSISQK